MADGSDFNGRPFLSSDHLKYLCFWPDGRINRQRICVRRSVLAVSFFIALVVGALWIVPGMAVLGVVILAAAYIFVAFAQIMLYIKRANGRDHTGWYILLTMIPLLGIIGSIELAFFSGTAGSNGYGADPTA